MSSFSTSDHKENIPIEISTQVTLLFSDLLRSKGVFWQIAEDLVRHYNWQMISTPQLVSRFWIWIMVYPPSGMNATDLDLENVDVAKILAMQDVGVREYLTHYIQKNKLKRLTNDIPPPVTRYLKYLHTQGTINKSSFDSSPSPPVRQAVERIYEQAASEYLHNAIERGKLRLVSDEEHEKSEQAYSDLAHYLLEAGPRLRRQLPLSTSWIEVVQDTLISVHQSFSTCAIPSAFLAWAMAILGRKISATQADLVRHVASSSDIHSNTLETNATTSSDLYDRYVDSLGDVDVFKIIRAELPSMEERLIVLALMLGLKRRDILLLFDDFISPNHFDHIRRATRQKLWKSERFLALFRP